VLTCAFKRAILIPCLTTLWRGFDNPSLMWSRDQKLLLASLVFIVLTCIAAFFVVPEFRRWLGLGHEAQAPSNENSEGQKIRNSNATSHRSPETMRPSPGPRPETEADPHKITGIGFDDLRTYVTWGNIKIHLRDIAIYDSGHSYLTFRICNEGSETVTVNNLFAWHTSENHEAITWNLATLVQEDYPHSRYVVFLRPGECRIAGAWSDKPSVGFAFQHPLGFLHISRDPDRDSSPLNLDQLELNGQLSF
jgi:hypothetical protein